MAYVSVLLRLVLELLQPGAHFLVVVFVGGVQVGAALQGRAVDGHLHRTDVAQAAQRHGLRLARLNHRARHLHSEARRGELALGVAQLAGVLPAAPFVESVVYVAYLLLCRHARAVLHVAVSLDGGLAGHVEVGVDMGERVEPVDVFRLVDAHLGLPLVLPYHAQRGEACGLPVAGGMVVVVERAEVAHLVSYHAQHVVAEYLAVISLCHHRAESVSLGARQGAHVGHGHGLVPAGQHGGRVVDIRVCGVYAVQHGGANGLQHRVVGPVALGSQPVDGRAQRVGGHLGRNPGLQQPGLEQLAVCLFGAGLGLYLLQNAYSCLWQILVGCLVGLLPQRRIALPEHRHGQQCQRNDYA